jgi:hypothetical protein
MYSREVLHTPEWAPTGILSTRRGRIPWFPRSASRDKHDNKGGNTEGFSW